MLLYAAKCDLGYVKFEKDGILIVDMQKASVFKDIDALRAVFPAAEELAGVRAVEMCIVERNVSLD